MATHRKRGKNRQIQVRQVGRAAQAFVHLKGRWASKGGSRTRVIESNPSGGHLTLAAAYTCCGVALAGQAARGGDEVSRRFSRSGDSAPVSSATIRGAEGRTTRGESSDSSAAAGRQWKRRRLKKPHGRPHSGRKTFAAAPCAPEIAALNPRDSASRPQSTQSLTWC
jgi:hypothetical protein